MLVLWVVIAVWILLQVHTLLTDPGAIPLVEALAARLPRERSLVLPQGAGKIEVPLAFVRIGAYGTAAAVLAIGAGIANAMLRAGASLWRDDPRTHLREQDSNRGS